MGIIYRIWGAIVTFFDPRSSGFSHLDRIEKSIKNKLRR